MKKKELTKIVVEVSKPKGWAYRSGSFYKEAEGLIAVLTLEPSQYSESMQIDIGCCPKIWWPDRSPPNAAHGGLRNFGTDIEDPSFQAQMIALDEELPVTDLREAFGALLDWIEANFLKREVVIKDVLATEDIHGRTGMCTLMMREWAKAQVKQAE